MHKWQMVIALAGSAASAQVTTNCFRNGAYTTCNTTAPPPPVTYPALQIAPSPNYGEMFARAQALRAQQAAAQAQAAQAEQERIAASNQEYFSKRAGELVAAGQCDDAVRLAFNNGQWDLARHVREACVGK